MARKRSAETELRWRKLVDRQSKSDRSVREFCEQEGVSENSLYSWRRKLAETQRRKVQVAQRKPDMAAAPDFIPVQINGLSTTMELVHPLGYQIRIDGRLDLEMLRQVLDVLERRGEA